MTALLAAVAAATGVLALAELVGARSGRGRRSTRRRPTQALLDLILAMGGPAARRARPGEPAGSRLEAAGLDLTAADLVAMRTGGAGAAVLLATPVCLGLPPRGAILVAAAAAAAAVLAPDVWIGRRTRRRARTMAGELADLLDLLRVAMDAGFTVRRALTEVGRRHRGLLAAEFARAAADLELGRPLAPTLAALRARVPLPAAAPLAAALERAGRHGTSAAPALRSLAQDARADATRAVAEHAARAAPKVQLVVALLLVPAAMLLVAAAMLPALK